MKLVKEDLRHGQVLSILADSFKALEECFQNKEVNLYVHLNEISVCVDLGPTNGGYQGIFNAERNHGGMWKITAHNSVAEGLKPILDRMY